MSIQSLPAAFEQFAPAPSEPTQESAAPDRVLSPAERKLRFINLGAVVIPFAGLALAIYLAWGSAFNWTQCIISLSMSLCTALGITVGFHRLATHKSFETPAPLRYLFAAFGSMAVQGPVIEWAGAHRRHHQHSD